MNKSTNKLLIRTVLLLAVCSVMGLLMYVTTKPGMGKGVDSFSAKYSDKDSVMIEGRHYGCINLDKFLKLASSAASEFDTDRDVSYSGDSVFVRVNKKSMFYGYNDGTLWRERYINSHVVSFTDSGFRAKVVVKDSVRYLYMPYQILICVSNYVGEHVGGGAYGTDADTVSRQTLRKKDIDMIKERALASTGKIQTGGYVFNNLTDILADHADVQGDRHAQLQVVWQYVYNHWNYINDPYGTVDTWRSASETIENYYFVSGKKYSGDCDDFAILMASFARQLGYRSRVVTAFNNQGEGHAYAQYFRDNGWYSMDWFGRIDGTPFNGVVDGVYEDL